MTIVYSCWMLFWVNSKLWYINICLIHSMWCVWLCLNSKLWYINICLIHSMWYVWLCLNSKLRYINICLIHSMWCVWLCLNSKLWYINICLIHSMWYVWLCLNSKLWYITDSTCLHVMKKTLLFLVVSVLSVNKCKQWISPYVKEYSWRILDENVS